MTPAEFRKLALALPGAEEHKHMDHPDFRVNGKIFATLGYPNEGWAMVKLYPDQQRDLEAVDPGVFVKLKGAWGRKGCTNVLLADAKPARVKAALHAAWRNAAVRTALQRVELAQKAETTAARKQSKSRAVLPARETS
ncbi:MAG: MmcQ/YjbR family DNA-binding protein [Acidobacteriaceae bacterium]